MGLFSFLKNKFKGKTDDNSLIKYDKGLIKAKNSFKSKLEKIGSGNDIIPSDYFENIEEMLLEADIGVGLTTEILEEVIKRVTKEKIVSLKAANEILLEIMFNHYYDEDNVSNNEIEFNQVPTVLLVVGVNGVGKTTSIAKIAYRYKKQGKKILIGAADTFRAGAKEQLIEWGKRLDIPVITGPDNSDPASVAYLAAKKAKEDNIDLLIIDTAGRLQNKVNLMNELNKISRVIKKEIDHAPDEVFLVLDATTGQNGLVQAKVFNETIKITGVVITKMDGTSKGGIILSINHDLHLPIKFIGLGEGMDDLELFNINNYLHGLGFLDEDER